MEVGSIIFLITVILIALVFEFINGFHDAANAIATVVSTKVLTPRTAIIYGASLEFIGALMGTHVAKTIGQGIVDSHCVTMTVIICALMGAIVWNLLTWYFGLPSSSSHALIGGLMGAAIMKSGIHTIHFTGVYHKVIIPMVSAPLIGITIGFLVMLSLMRFLYKVHPEKIDRRFRRIQIFSSGLMALSHGSNDAQKTMGIIALALFSSGATDTFHIPIWVIFVCACVMSAGILSGGWKIIITMGSKIIKLKPINGFAAETSAASVILVASHLGIPLSTTQIISTAIMGVGATKRLSAVKWGIVGNIVTAWILTIPVCMTFSAIIYFIISRIQLLF